MQTFPAFNRIRGRWYPDEPDLGDLPIFLLFHLSIIFVLPFFIGIRFTPVFLSATLATVALFLPIYFAAWRAQKNEHLVLLVMVMTLLGMLTMQFNPGGNTYLVFGCAFAARNSKLCGALWLFLLVSCCGFIASSLSKFGFWSYSFPMLVSVGVFFGNRLNMSSAKNTALLRMSQDEVARLAKTAERERIARDLHDLIGHTLTVVALKTQLARKLVTRDPSAAMAQMQELEDLARDALSEVRDTVHGMRSAEIPVELAKSKMALGAAQIVLHSQLAVVELPQALENALAYVLREAVNNIVRHSRGSEAWIELRQCADRVSLDIRDNGRCLKLSEGHGLSAMRERLAAVAGSLHLEHGPGGVCIHVSAPHLPGKKPRAEAQTIAERAHDSALHPSAAY
jgi:two-component system, NarL family, sensor histidine kinase DesK